jgi:hypothetical protein
MVTTAPELVVFGHGHHACPGWYTHSPFLPVSC